MSYKAFPVTGFGGGLNLRDQGDVIDPAQAIDLLNVTLTERGAVRSRDGFGKLNSTGLTNQGDSIFGFYTSGGSKRLIVGNGNRLDAFDTFPGPTAANTTSPTASPHFFTRFGGPAVEAVYIANGTDRIRRYDTAGGFTNPAGLSGITGKFLAVQSPDNRLVCARFIGTTGVSNPSTVRFSAEGDPETFGANDYVQLDPGDGEAIMGIATFRDQLVVFKQTKFYVFYGNSVDATGEPVFNFRRVDAGVGLAASKALCTGRDGIYFLDRTGVYRTTGSDPQQVSDIIDPFFLGGVGPSFTSDPLNKSLVTQSVMCWHDERLYLSVPSGVSATNDRVLVHDPRYGWWSLYDIPASAMCSFRPGNDEELVFTYSSGANLVGRHGAAYSADQSLEEETNLSTNPGGEVVAKFTAGADYTITRQATGTDGIPSRTGGFRDKHAFDGTETVDTIATLGGHTFAAAGTYVVSLYVWIPTAWDGGAPVIDATSFTGSSGEAQTAADLSLGDQWQRIHTTVTVASGDLVGNFLLERGASAPSSAPTGIIYSDDLQIEAGTIPSDYFDGNSSDGYWTGAVNASTSVRVSDQAISSRWRSGWPDFGDPNVKTVRETRVWGSGKCSFRLTRDFQDTGTDTTLTFGSSGTDTWGDGTGTDTWGDGTSSDLWGPARASAPRLVRQARRGTVFSVTLSHDVLDESWSVHGLDHHLRDFRFPSTPRSEVSA